MPIYRKDSRLSEPIIYDPSVIQVIHRFGFNLGVGDITIRDACMQHHIDVEFFLAVINTFLNSTYYPEEPAGNSNLDLLLEYLAETDRYYSEVLLPNIERHFDLLYSRRGNPEAAAGCEEGAFGSSNLGMLRNFFNEVRNDMKSFIDYDLNIWIPSQRNREGDAQNGDDIHNPGLIEDKLEDMIRLFVVHLRGPYDNNLCVAVLSSMHALAKDVRQNNRIRTRILKPLCER